MRRSGADKCRMVWGALVLAAVVILASGCGDPVRRKVESGIEDALPRLIGPAKSYDVTVSGSTFGLIKGKIRAAHIQGRDIRLPSGIIVAELDVVSHGLQIDRHSQEITSVLDTSYKATLGQDALNKYLCDTYSQVPELKAELANGQLNLSAAPEVAGVHVRISAEAGLKVRDNHYLILDLRKVSVVGIGTPGFAREYLESRLNPVFDTATLGYEAKVDRVSIRPARLTIEGTLDLASHPRAKGGLPDIAVAQASSSASP